MSFEISPRVTILERQRRVEDKLDSISTIQDEHTEQLTRIENSFHEHVIRQHTLMEDIQETLGGFLTCVEDTISREINKLKGN
jgi:hypothetical protein